MIRSTAMFSVGQTINHKIFDYRGVIVDVDANFQGDDEWYENMALTRPPKDQPWYRVLVHGGSSETYVAERNLRTDMSGEPVNHPYITLFFDGFEGGIYHASHPTN